MGNSNYNLTGFELELKNLIAWKKTFFVETKSSWKKVYLKNKNRYREIVFFTGEFLDGIFIANLTRRNIAKRIKQNLYLIPKFEDNYSPTIISYNKINCRNNVGKELIEIDINNCYWNTLLFIDAIDKQTHDKALKKASEWKLARNATIGSFGRTIRIDYYQEGVLQKEKTKNIKDSYAPIRLQVLDFVWRNCKKIINSSPKDSFCFFITDCFFVEESSAHYYYSCLDSLGYEYKTNKVKINSIDNNKVIWQVEGETELKHYTFNEKRQEIHNL